jgi:hypothetical protein
MKDEYCDATTESRNSGARARRPLLSNVPEITFPLRCIAMNESLTGNKLLNTRFPWKPTGQHRTINCSGRLAVIKSSGFVNSEDSVIRKFRRQSNSWTVNQLRLVAKQRLTSRRRILYFLCYSYSNLQSVIITCSYRLRVSNKSIRLIQNPLLSVTQTSYTWQYCDEIPESRNSGIGSEVDFLGNELLRQLHDNS